MKKCVCVLTMLLLGAALLFGEDAIFESAEQNGGTIENKMNPEPAVLPALQSWKGASGTLALHQARIIIDKPFEKQLLPTAKIFQTDWLKGCGREMEIRVGKETLLHGDILLTLNTSGKAIPSTEGYMLQIGDTVKLSANTPAGIFYGTRTIMQVSMKAPTNPQLPKGEILDYPKYRKRMLMLDVGRTFLPYDKLLDFIRQLGWVKMNTLHLHLSDFTFDGLYDGFRMGCEMYPELTAKDGFYTKKQIREMQDFARLHGVTIIPEIDSPGHALSFTRIRPDLLHPKLGKENLDLTNPGTIPFMESIFDEFVPLFDAPYFHIGTDEFRLGTCTEEEKLEIGEAFRNYINHMNRYINAKGKKVIIWSGYEHMPGKTEIDKNITIDMWVTADAPNKSKAGYDFINSNHGCTYVCPGVPYYGVSNPYIYNDWYPHIFGKPEYNVDPEDPGLLGGKIHVWGDVAPTGQTYYEIAHLLLPSLHTFSEKMWGRKGSSTYDEFAQRAESLSKVPGSRIFVRDIKSDREGRVYDTGETVFELKSVNDFIELAEFGQKELEYPWTLKMTLMPAAVSDKRSVVLGSSLAEICTELPLKGNLGYHGIEANEKSDSKEKHFGFGIERANHWSPIPIRPTHKKWRTLHVYDVHLPVNTWSTITMIGEQSGVSLYIDSKFIGKSSKYLLCPLETIGSRYGDSFIGKVKGISIHNRKIIGGLQPPPTTSSFSRDEVGPVVGSWKAPVDTAYTQVDFDVTGKISADGTYIATFGYTNGACMLKIRSVSLIVDANEVARDDHVGSTGGNHEFNRYTFDVKGYIPGKPVKLRADIASGGGTDSNGLVYLTKK